MATMIHPGAGGRRLSLAGRPLVFQRGHRPPSLQKSRKRLTLRLKHVLALFVVLVGFFLALGKVYLFLVSWDKLTIRTYDLHGGRDEVRGTVDRILRSGPLGNILLCDLQLLQDRLKACPWVKEARIQKVFPASLRIEITDRVPFALFEKGSLALVAEDGTVLEPSVQADSWLLPVVRDEGSFLVRLREKWEAARACLKDLSDEERSRLASLECSDDGRITLRFRQDPLRLILDGTAVREKLDFFAAHREAWEGLFGALDYVDLRFEGRAIVRPLEPPPEDTSAKSQKEAE
jgi:cell division septal protein FtsQ